MKILMAASEAVPFAKTGGLADVAGSLTRALRRLGHDAALILPAWRATRENGIPMEPTGIPLDMAVGNRLVPGQLLRGTIPGTDIPVWFVDQPEYFDRPALYGESSGDYADNDARFIFFARAVIETTRRLGWKPDVIHCNDWQTALIPAYLRLLYGEMEDCRRIATLLTIHNIAYQGSFAAESMRLTGIDGRHFHPGGMEYYGKLNFLKCGLVFATLLNTVSRRYSEEIQTDWFGCGMEGVLRVRQGELFGILNGINEEEWNPTTDPFLTAAGDGSNGASLKKPAATAYRTYDVSSVEVGKTACKAALQAEFGLPVRADVPLFGTVGRLVEQKGYDLIARWLEWTLPHQDCQCVLVGAGKPELQAWFAQLADRFPDRLRVKFVYSEALAHRVIAGSDAFLMPSRFEPCGLTQMYSMRYGTIPVVRETGGLADTVVSADAESLAAGTATGFSFYDETPEAFADAVNRTTAAYHTREMWRKLQQCGMNRDWSWSRSAKQYVEIYQRAVERAVYRG